MTAFGITQVDESQETLSNDGFFPDVKISDFQNQFHQVNDVDTAKVKAHLIDAMVEINRQLKRLKDDASVATLSALDESQVGGMNVQEVQYFRAVFAYAKANLLPFLLDVMSKDKGEVTESNREQLQGEFMGISNKSVRVLLGLNNGTVELI